MDDLILKLSAKGSAGSVIRVSRTPSTIGRHPDCEVHLPYASVSQRHARIESDGSGRWFVDDLGSANGTYVNGRRIASPHILEYGDVLNAGPATLAVLLGESHVEASDPASSTILCRNAVDLRSQWVGAGESLQAKISENVRIDRLNDLVDIAKGLNLAVSMDAIFEQVQDVVFRHFLSVDRLALLVDVEDSLELDVLKTASRHAAPPKNAERDERWLSRTICQKAYRERAAIQTADAQLDARFDNAASIVVNDIRSAMAVPLWNEDHVVGVLYADAHLPALHWQRRAEDDLGFFCALANLVAASVQRWRLSSRLQNVEQVRRRLERYHSPFVVRKMLSGACSQGGRLLPEERQLTVLFADIVGFTALSEKLTPVGVAALLNRFFEEMLAVLFEKGGTLDKYIGDCIMAFFGAPQDQADHARRAVGAALGMLDRLEELNRNGVFVPPLQIRIAINTGAAVVGDVGSETRLEYTALGPTINIASRMEGICSPGDCVISEATFTQLDDRGAWVDLGELQFRGIQRPVRVFSSGRSPEPPAPQPPPTGSPPDPR